MTTLFYFSVLAFVSLSGALFYKQKQYQASMMTPEKQLIIRAKREEDQFFKALQKEALFLSKEIPTALAIQNRLTHNYYETRRDNRGRKRKKSLVTFDAILMTDTEIWFHFNGRKLPYGVSFSDIKDPNNHVLDNLQYAIHRPCRFYEDSQFNLFLRVGLKNAIMGIPRRVEWLTVVGVLPKSNTFTVAIGVNDHGKVIYKDVRDWPHMIIAGATGYGKSTQLMQWITTLIKRNSPDMCQFVFVDLKEGLSLGQFQHTPHALNFVRETGDVLDALEWLVDEYKRRLRLFDGVCKDIKEWNGQRPDKLQYIFLIVDELADLMNDKRLNDKATELLMDIARKGRAAGVHAIVATQIVEKNVLPVAIRGNFPARCAFAVPGVTESLLVLGKKDAAKLGHVGRCVFMHGVDLLTLQAPIASDEEIQKVIDNALGGGGRDAHKFDYIDLFTTVLLNLDGKASWREIKQSVGDLMSQNKIKETLRTYEYKLDKPESYVINIDSETYILLPAFRDLGSRARQLVSVDASKLPLSVDEMKELLRVNLRVNDENLRVKSLPAPESVAEQATDLNE